MLKNYLKIAFRSLWKHKLYSFINIFGLALSLSVCMMILVMTRDHLSFDRFHPHPERTYRVISDVTESKTHNRYELASTPLPLHTALLYEKNAVETSVRIYPALNGKAVTGNKEITIRGAFTENSFFEVFGFSLASGDRTTALSQANGIVLASETALKLFGKNDPIGQPLDLGKLGIYQVTGVLSKTPGKSHLNFDAYASSAAVTQLEKSNVLPLKLENWFSMQDAYTYVLLKENARSSALTGILNRLSAELNKNSKEGSLHFSLQPLTSITPASGDLYNDTGNGTTWGKFFTEVGIGFIILLAACFNYTNLTIARALTRAKEVGIRKVAGASRYQVFVQYIVEAVVLALFALVIAYVILLLILQYKPFNDGYEMVPNVKPDLVLLITALIFTLVTGTAAGSFPAWILSSFKAVRVMKNVSTEKLFGNLSLQKTLTVFQFSLSLLIIIFLSAFYRQFSYIGTLDPGFQAKNVLSVPFSGSGRIFLDEAAQVSGVESISQISDNFGARGSGNIPVYTTKPGAQQHVNSDFYFGDASTLSVMKLTLAAGTNFTATTEKSGKERQVLINEKAAALFGYKHAADAVGKTIWLNDSTEIEIRGVLKDFYHLGAVRNITPMLLRNASGNYGYLNIRVDPAANQTRVVNELSAIWKKLNPHSPFVSHWLDQQLADGNNQGATYSLLGFLAFITLSIASLGLLGLVIYTVETRRKEISIRKIIGADVGQLMTLLSKGFIRLLLIAGLIAMPLGYLLSFFFLQNFANRVPFGPGIPVVCFLFLLGVGLVTILSNTFKASTENPVKNLRSE